MASLRGFGALRDPIEELEAAIEECLATWRDDPAYKNAGQKLREVERELDVLEASPGHRAALRGSPSVGSGQEQTEESSE